MNAIRYYVLTTPHGPTSWRGDARGADPVAGVSPIDVARFAAAGADRPPDARADVAGLLRAGAGELARALAARSRRLPLGAEVYWRVNVATGWAEGWVATPAAAVTTRPVSADSGLPTRTGGGLGPSRNGGGIPLGSPRLPSLSRAS